MSSAIPASPNSDGGCNPAHPSCGESQRASASSAGAGDTDAFVAGLKQGMGVFLHRALHKLRPPEELVTFRTAVVGRGDKPKVMRAMQERGLSHATSWPIDHATQLVTFAKFSGKQTCWVPGSQRDELTRTMRTAGWSLDAQQLSGIDLDAWNLTFVPSEKAEDPWPKQGKSAAKMSVASWQQSSLKGAQRKEVSHKGQGDDVIARVGQAGWIPTVQNWCKDDKRSQLLKSPAEVFAPRQRKTQFVRPKDASTMAVREEEHKKRVVGLGAGALAVALLASMVAAG